MDYINLAEFVSRPINLFVYSEWYAYRYKQFFDNT